MNAFSPDFIDRLGWVLIQSLWQFAIAAIVTAVIVAVLRRRSATSRYAVLVVAMLMMVVAPCATWIIFPASGWASALRVNAFNADPGATLILEASINNSVVPTPSEAPSEIGATMPNSQPGLEFDAADAVDQTRRAGAQPLAEELMGVLRPWFSWIVGSWLIGVLLCSLRPLLGWRMLRRLRRIGISPPSDEVLAVFARVSQRLGLRRSVQLLHSTLATGPLVVGYLKPIVLLPVSLVSSIPLSQLEAIFAHEVAHIRRHDFIINLAQTLMETLFFYHPAIWWLSRRIRIEREHCCDDLVVKLFNNGIDYGRALVAIEQLKSQRTILALGARDGSLLGRIRRISGATSPQSRFFPSLATPIALSVVCGMWIAGQEFNLVAETHVNVNSIAASEPETSQKPVQADLPTGVRVTLVGVTTPIVMTDDLLKQRVVGALAPLPTAENPDTREWWSGDGLKLDTAPEPGQSWMVRKGWEDGRQFAFEISGLPDADSELRVVMFHNRAAQPQQAVAIIESKSQSDQRKRIVLGAIAPNAEAVSATLELRIGTGKSATVKFDRDGERIDSLDDEAALHSDSMKQIIEEIKFLRIVQKGNDIDVWTRPITTNGQLGSVSYSVVDKTGKSHSSSGGYSMNDEQLTPFKNLNVADIREIHFEIRAFDHSVTFENVSRKSGTKSEVKVAFTSLPAEKPPVAAASESTQEPVDDTASAFAAYLARFAGTVEDDTGQPLEGAKIYITRAKSPDVFSNGMGQQSASERGNTDQTNLTPVRATTDANGHFQFDAPEMIGEKPDGTPALYDGWVVAKKDGYGTDFFQTLGTTYNGSLWSTIGVDRAMIEMQLTKDDVPVRGRLLDPDGKPLAGALVTMKSIGIPRKLSLDAHLEREIAANERSGFLSGRSIYKRSIPEPTLVPGLTTSIQTNTDGWFEFNGIGRERLVTLSVRHPAIQDAQLEVMTRVAPDVGTIQDQNGKPTQTIHGSGFTKQMPAGLTIRGIVRDRITKAPLTGIWVTTNGHPVAHAAYNPNPAVTDKDGRFTITGINPIYAKLAKEKRDIDAFPQPGIPYVMSRAFFEVNAETIIECEPGIPFRMKVTDETGKPVAGELYYLPVSPNPIAQELFNPFRLGSYHRMQAARREDGTYEGVAVPGPGAVVFRMQNGQSYRPASVDPKSFFAYWRTDWPSHADHLFGTSNYISTVFGSSAIQGDYEAIVLVNPPEDSAPLELSATVFKDRPRRVHVVDADGKPIMGVEATGLWPDRKDWSTLSSSTFTLRRMYRDRLKQVTFNHKDRNLTAILLARGDTDEPITVVMQSPATVTGRLILQDGKPMKNPHLAMRATDEGADVLRLGKPEPDGRFRIEGLIPGLSFASVNSGDVVRFVTLDGQAIENMVLQPGEVRDVGDVKVVSDEQ